MKLSNLKKFLPTEEEIPDPSKDEYQGKRNNKKKKRDSDKKDKNYSSSSWN